MYYNDGHLAFQLNGQAAANKTLEATYTNFENTTAIPPWINAQKNIKTVSFGSRPIAVTSLYSWFENCTSLTTVDGTNFNSNYVQNMRRAFYGCTSLVTGLPFGPNVTSTYQTYAECHNFAGPPSIGNCTKVTGYDGGYTFVNCRNMKGQPECYPNAEYFSSVYLNCHNITGAPVFAPRLKEALSAYENCYNLTGQVPELPATLTRLQQTFSGCNKLTGSPRCTDMIENFMGAYSNCINLTGSPVCGANVTAMYGTYTNCRNLTGSPVCGPKVTTLGTTYANCINLTGSPVCGANVTSMYAAYQNCTNLTGAPVCGNKVTDFRSAYRYCNKLSGTPVCGPNVNTMDSTYSGCTNLSAGNCYFYSPSVASMNWTFEGRNASRRWNIYVPSNSTTLTTLLASTTKLVTGTPLTWTDAGSYYYNTQQNIYIYPVTNVMAAKVANKD